MESYKNKDVIGETNLVSPHSYTVPDIKLRSYQLDFAKAFFSSQYDQFVLCWSRRSGKDVACFSVLITLAFYVTDVYLYCLPLKETASSAILMGVMKDGRRFIDIIPPIFVYSINYQKQVIVLHHPSNYEKLVMGVPLSKEEKLRKGSIIYFLGLDKNPESDRGIPARVMIVSEYDFMTNPEVISTYIPMILERNGKVVYNSTPNGMQHFYELWTRAKLGQKKGEFKNFYLSKVQTYFTEEPTYLPLMSKPKILELAKQLGFSESKVEQEFGCRFIATGDGSIFGSVIDVATENGRLGDYPHNKDYPVHLSFDIGYTDSTAIWFFQVINDKIYYIDYFEASSRPIEYYAKILEDRKFEEGYSYGDMVLPHDANANTSIGSSYSNQMHRIMRNYKFKARIKIAKRMKVKNSIDFVRSKFHLVHFDESLRDVVRHLSLYRYSIHPITKALSTKPVHDEYSHCADSFRYSITATVNNTRFQGRDETYPTVIKMKRPSIKW